MSNLSLPPSSAGIGKPDNGTVARFSMQDFMSEESCVDVVPAFDCPVLSFISGDYGPFTAGMAVTVPLWLAVELRKQYRCRITPPAWLCEEFLQSVLNYEKDPLNETFFSSAPSPLDPSTPLPLPYHYQSIATVLLQTCPSDFPKPKSLLPLLQDIEFLRSSKSSNILKRLSRTIDGSDGDGEVEKSFNMRSGWKAMEVQGFKGVTCKMLEGVRGLAYGKEEGKKVGSGVSGGGGGGGETRSERPSGGRRKFQNSSRRRDENTESNNNTTSSTPNRQSQASNPDTPTVDEDGLEIANIEDGEELEEPTRQGGALRRFR
ncbi:hypothetical protein TrLO_g15946 [Triparma laevis f. longispina]|uniref:DNA replication complex GINS protein PSF2 N-terminal domain-containing protein n=1 Tax=Triparma laevis f. longispina TaxID=1714387 RepID=A0A9W6ZTJ3_9STRA|nr:hypothetical protein TrLO_g15946 [Triparma laevis f. longispina]